MNKKEIAKLEKMFRDIGLNEKQIKTLIKSAPKNTTAADVATLVIWAWAFGAAFALVESAGLSKDITLSRVIRFLKKYQN
jgi:hypothetical protein